MEDKAIRGIPWTFVTFASTKVITSLTTIGLARLLVPDDFGLFALAILVSDIIGLVRDLGFGGTMIVRQDLDRRSQGTMLTLMLVSSAVTAGLVAGLAPVAASVFDEPRLTEVLLAISITAFLGGPGLYYETLLQRELEFRRRFVARFVSTLLYAGTALCCAALGLGVWSLVIALAVQMLSGTLIAMALAPYRVPPAFDAARAVDLFKTGRGFLAQTVLSFSYRTIDFLVVGRAFGATQLGLYTVAFRVAELPYAATAEPVAKAVFPGFARMRHRGEDVTRSYLTTQRVVALIIVPGAVILSAAADPFVRAVLGEKWLAAEGVLAILGLWAAVRGLGVTQSWVLNATRNTNLTAMIWAGLLAALIPGLVLAALYGSIETVAWVVLGNGVLAFLAQAVAVNRRLRIPARDQWRAIRPAAVAGPAAWLVTWSVARALDDISPWLTLVVCSAAGVVAYLAVVSVCEPGLLRQTAGRTLRVLGIGTRPPMPSRKLP